MEDISYLEDFVEESDQEEFEEYNPDKNYKLMHLNWLGERKSFAPRWFERTDQFPTYIKKLESMYLGANAIWKDNLTAYYNLRDDYNIVFGKKKTATDEVHKMFGGRPTKNKWFITFNWDDKNFNKKLILKSLEALIKKKWVISFVGVFEYYGMDGNHPHLHTVIEFPSTKEFDEKYKINRKLFDQQISDTLAHNFIQTLRYRKNHTAYTLGVKCEAKQENLLKDKDWREENGLHHVYRKVPLSANK